jgi:hypothetical protein
MELTNAQNVRKILASNFETLTSNACHYRNFPRQISVTRIDDHTVARISQANFAFQIGAIDDHDYGRIRHLTIELTTAVKYLRKVYNADNYLCGQAQAISAAKDDVTNAIASLNLYLDRIKHDGIHHTVLTTP